ncbi:unnamed protein product [Pleuronectes platessa]|uniref:Uncharacterized protein n=1 Tax=Pleuronectes platessa TaxID=8262 RepID=A0A9N7TSZ9_PLEPL|nr:unnamed protein product [Pleuronectes platessa]
MLGQGISPSAPRVQEECIQLPASSMQQDTKACPKPDPGSCNEKGDPWFLEACHPFMSLTLECSRPKW